MNKVYTIQYESGEAQEVGSKKTAIKRGEESGERYEVLSPSGQVVAGSISHDDSPVPDTEPVDGKKVDKALGHTVDRDYPGNYSIVTAPMAVLMAEAAGLSAEVKTVKGRLNKIVSITGDKEAVLAFVKVLDATMQETFEALHVWQKKHAADRRGLTDMEKYLQHRDFIAKAGKKAAKSIKAERA